MRAWKLTTAEVEFRAATFTLTTADEQRNVFYGEVGPATPPPVGADETTQVVRVVDGEVYKIDADHLPPGATVPDRSVGLLRLAEVEPH